MNVTGLMFAIAGAMFFAFGMGWIGGMLAHQVGGGLILLAGLGTMAHAMNMCPTCKAQMGWMKKK